MRHAYTPATHSPLPDVDVIVATYNSLTRSHLAKCLQSIVGQRYLGVLKLFVVDGGSTDGSRGYAQSLGATIIDNPRITELGYEGGKNLGFHNSQGTLVSMVDADNTLIGTDYFRRMTMPFVEDPTITMSLPSPYVPSKEEASSICRYFALVERAYWQRITSGAELRDFGWSHFKPSSAIVPNAAVLRRTALESVGGFDYDTEVGVRLVAKGLGDFAWVPRAFRFHSEIEGYGSLWRKLRRRVANQFAHNADKPAVDREMRTYLANPLGYIKSELCSPLQAGFRSGDRCYLNALPVFVVKSALVAWHMAFAGKNFSGCQVTL